MDKELMDKSAWMDAIKQLFAEGELWGSGDPTAVDLPGSSPGLLAFHGFGATPNEVRLLTDVAAEHGLAARAPVLPGHGTRPEDLAGCRYADWYAAADKEFRKAAANGPVIVAGQSMGSVVAMDLAAQHPGGVAALIVLAPATRLMGPYPNVALAIAERVGLPDFLMPKFGGPDIGVEQAKQAHRTYSTQPMRAAMSLRRAGLRVLDKLHHIRCPAFIAHGQGDRVCPVSNAWEVADRLGTPEPEVMLLARSRHIVTMDADRQRLAERLHRFIGNQLST